MQQDWAYFMISHALLGACRVCQKLCTFMLLTTPLTLYSNKDLSKLAAENCLKVSVQDRV